MASDLSIPHLEDEGDVCRVCRVEGDEENPLIHPCKCSGSVRFVHPDCLKLWLAQSQKKYCEICGHRYTFTKVYPEQLPTRIPITVYIRQTLLYLLRYSLTFARICLVIVAWLVVLPSLNMFSLRSMIWLADHVGMHNVDMSSTGNLDHLSNTLVTYDNGSTVTLLASASDASNLTVITMDGSNTTLADNASLSAETIRGISVGDAVAHPISTAIKLVTISIRSYMQGDEDTAVGFVLRGQILSISVAAVLIGLILLREWITQHNWRDHERPQSQNRNTINPDDWEIRDGQAHRKRPDWTELFTLDDSGKPTLNEDALRNLNLLPPPVEQPSEEGFTSTTAEDPDIEEDPMDDEPVAPGSIQEAIQAYRARHRQLKGAVNESSASDKEVQSMTDGEPAQLPSLARGMSPPHLPARDQNQIEDPPAVAGPSSSSARWTGEEEASTSEQKLDDLDSDHSTGEEPLSPSLSRPMSASSSGPGQKERIDVAFTAPELLRKNGKGKEKDGGEVNADDSVSIEDVPKEAADSATTESNPLATHAEETDTDVNDEADDDGDEGEWEDEPDDYENVDNRDEVGRAGAGPVVGPPQLGPADVAPIDGELIDELEADGWEGDDWNGVFEVIGLIGPLHNLLQNILFAVIIMGASLTLLVGVPLILGKIFLSFDFIRSMVNSGAAILRLVRKITDPAVDIILEIAKEVLFLPLLTSLRAAESIIARKLGLVSTAPEPSQDVRSRILRLLSTSSGDQVNTVSEISTVKVIASKAGDILALLGQYSYDGYNAYLSTKHNIANSDKVSDRVACMFVGYGVAGASVALVALAGEAGFGRFSSDLAANIKHHGMFLKLAFFMVLELAIFPLGIGLIIDGCTVPLFDGSTLAGRLDRLRLAPFGTVFVDWLVGTIFMYQFATLLSHIRTLCRPGTLFFIRDPADPSYSPVKDIIEKSSLSQLRKLSISALMYSVVVFCLFGAACWGLAYQPFLEILPLRLDPMYGPVTSVPFDLLFLHLVIPPAIDFVRPRQRGKRLMTMWWKWTVSMYRLSALMAKKSSNVSVTKERFIPSRRWELVWGLVDPLFQIAFGKYDPKSTDARVPASDQVALLPPAQRRAEGGVFVSVDENGSTTTPADKLRFLRQDKLARDNGRNPKNDYEIIHLPRYWRTRVHVFIGSALVMSSALVGTIVFLPIIIGRLALGWNRKIGVHDGYNYVAGISILLCSLQLGHFARKHILLSTRAKRLRRSGRTTRMKRTVLRWLAGFYGIFMTYGVLPVIVGALVEVYGVGMSRSLLESLTRKGNSQPGRENGVVVVHFWDIWASGTVLCSIFLGAIWWARPRGQLNWLDLVRERLRNPAPKYFATTSIVLLPTIKYLSIPLLLPLIISWATVALDGAADVEKNGMIFRALVPLCFTALAIRYGSSYAVNTLETLRQSMIDAEYVLEERVENYVPEPEAGTNSGTDQAESGGQDVDGEGVGVRGGDANVNGEVQAKQVRELEETDDNNDDDAQWINEEEDDEEEVATSETLVD